MRKVPTRKIMRSLCRSYKTDGENHRWSVVAQELLKLDFFKKRLEEIKKERLENARKRTIGNM